MAARYGVTQGIRTTRVTSPTRLVLLLSVGVFINYVDRGNLATAAPLIQGELHLSASQLGVLLSAFYYGYVLAMAPVGWFAEKYGAKRVLATGAIVWSIATLFTGVVSTFAGLLLLRLLMGGGESVAFPRACDRNAIGRLVDDEIRMAAGIHPIRRLLARVAIALARSRDRAGGREPCSEPASAELQRDFEAARALGCSYRPFLGKLWFLFHSCVVAVLSGEDQRILDRGDGLDSLVGLPVECRERFIHGLVDGQLGSRRTQPHRRLQDFPHPRSSRFPRSLRVRMRRAAGLAFRTPRAAWRASLHRQLPVCWSIEPATSAPPSHWPPPCR